MLDTFPVFAHLLSLFTKNYDKVLKLALKWYNPGCGDDAVQGRRPWRHMTSSSRVMTSRAWHHDHVTQATSNRVRVLPASSSAVTPLITWSRGRPGANQRHRWRAVVTIRRHGWCHLIDIITDFFKLRESPYQWERERKFIFHKIIDIFIHATVSEY